MKRDERLVYEMCRDGIDATDELYVILKVMECYDYGNYPEEYMVDRRNFHKAMLRIMFDYDAVVRFWNIEFDNINKRLGWLARGYENEELIAGDYIDEMRKELLDFFNAQMKIIEITK